MRRAYGKGLSDIFRLAPATSLTSRTLAHSTAAVTQIRCDSPDNGFTRPLAREDAFLLTLQLRDCPAHELWIDDKPVKTRFLSAGTVSLYDLRHDPRVNSISPFHNLHFYFKRTALVATVGGSDIRIDAASHNPGCGTPAPTLHALGQSLLPAFERPAEASKPFVQHVTAAVIAYVAHNFCSRIRQSR